MWNINLITKDFKPSLPPLTKLAKLYLPSLVNLFFPEVKARCGLHQRKCYRTKNMSKMAQK